MAALLRHAARRIGGPVLQRTQAAVTSPAVAEERRRLVPRLMHTEKRPTPEIQEVKEDLYAVLSEKEKNLNTSNWVNRRLLQYQKAMDVQQQKESLYEALSEVEKHLSWQDERLLQHLAVQVNVRPKDKQWLRLRLLKFVSSVWLTTGILSLSSVIAAGLFGLENYVAEKDRGPDFEKQEQ